MRLRVQLREGGPISYQATPSPSFHPNPPIRRRAQDRLSRQDHATRAHAVSLTHSLIEWCLFLAFCPCFWIRALMSGSCGRDISRVSIVKPSTSTARERAGQGAVGSRLHPKR